MTDLKLEKHNILKYLVMMLSIYVHVIKCMINNRHFPVFYF